MTATSSIHIGSKTSLDWQTILGNPQRMATLTEAGLLTGESDPALDRFTRLASRLLRSPVSVISAVTPERQIFKSTAGLAPDAERSTDLERSYCKHCIASEDKLVIEDATEHPLVKDNPATLEDGVQAYLGVPVEVDGAIIGTICVYDYEPHAWTDEQVAIMEDLAVAVGAELSLQLANNALRQSEKTRHELIALVAHELRTPLTSIVGFAQTMQQMWDRLEEPAKQQFIDVIAREGSRLQDVVSDLLVLSQAEGSGLHLYTRDFKLIDVLRQAIRQFSEHKINLFCDEDLYAHADPARVQQMLINYLGNAVKYGRDPICVEALAGRRDDVQIRVIDSGDGVSPDMLPKLFTKFSRGMQVTDATGTGLGLSIVQALAQAQGGASWYEARPDGACFAFSLPQSKTASQ